ncbi:MAG: hypothetical protein WD875_08850 [Pirellulales bacterium]
MNQPSGAWWKQLSNHLHERTQSRLRGLQIRAVGGRISIQASAPSDRVRSLAEAAAREIVPDGLLALRIEVDGPIDRISTPTDLPEQDGRDPRPSQFSGQVIYRRMHRLVNGN